MPPSAAGVERVCPRRHQTFHVVPSSTVLELEPTRIFAWRYAHLPIFGAIAAIGAGLRVAAEGIGEGHLSLPLIALALAHLLSYKLRGSTFFRVSMLMPYATSVAAATIVFAMLFGRDFGLINWFLGVFGIDNIDWENGRWTSQIAISPIVTWRWTGYNALIYLAAIQAIPKRAIIEIIPDLKIGVPGMSLAFTWQKRRMSAAAVSMNIWISGVTDIGSTPPPSAATVGRMLSTNPNTQIAATPARKMATMGSDYRTNPVTQIKWGLDYIKRSYGTPCNALDFWNSRSPHWY